MNPPNLELPIFAISTNSVDEQRREEERRELISNFFKAGAAAGGVWGTSKLIRDNQAFQNWARNNSPLKTLDASVNNISSSHQKWQDLFAPGKDTIGVREFGMNALRMFEENTPFRIGRTFDLSHFATPLATGRNIEYTVSGKAVQLEESMFKKLLETRGNRDLTPEDFKHGFHLKDGSLYGFDSMGNVDFNDKVLNEARLAATEFTTAPGLEGERITFRNHVLEHYRNVIGVTESFNHRKLQNAGEDSFVVIGGKTKNQMDLDWVRAFGRGTIYRGARVFDAPADGIIEMIPGAENSKLLQWARQKLRLNLWSGSDNTTYHLPVPEQLKIAGKSIAKKSLVAAIGYGVADKAVRTLAGDDESNPWSKGLLAGGATTLVNAHIALAEALFDPLQGYKNKQEELAPGSTGFLAGAVALPAMGVLYGGMGAYVKRVYDNMMDGIEKSDKAAHVAKKILPGLKYTGGRAARLMVRGGLIGAALTAPFIPGALIGRSSEELKAEYSGEKEVAVRANRWWYSGANPYEGDRIKYFTKGWYARMMSGSDDKSKYGDQETKDALNPLLHPFDYLRDPYRFEKMHEEDRPYPVWGMDVSGGAFFGKLFERTIGQIIKPDRINPKLVEHLQKENGGAVTGTGRALLSGGELSDKVEGDGDTLHIKTPVSEAEASLIAEGKMLGPRAATLEKNESAAKWSWDAFKDFIGLRGWVTGLIEEGAGFNIDDKPLQLARSGEATNAAREISDLNLGGMAGLCFAKGTRVKTIEGYKPIEDISIGEMVFSLDGKCKRVIDTIEFKKHSKQLVKLRVSTVDTTLLVTENHWFPALKRKKYSNGHAAPLLEEDIYLRDYQVKDIEVGDFLVYPIISESECRTPEKIDLYTGVGIATDNYIYYGKFNQEFVEIYEAIESGRLTTRRELREAGFSDSKAKEALRSIRTGQTTQRIKRHIEPSNDLYYLIGWFLAEGFCSNTGYRTGFVLGSHEYFYVIELRKIIKDIFGLDAEIKQSNESSISIIINNVIVNSFFKHYFGEGCFKKCIHPTFKHSAKEQIVHLLSSALTGDGWQNGDFGGFTSVSKELTQDIFDLLLRVGILSNLVLDYSEAGKGNLPQGDPRGTSVRNYLEVSRGSSKALAEVIERQIPTSLDRRIGGKSFIYNGLFFVKVRSKESIEDQPPVYDLTIEDLSYYVVERVCTHNTEGQRRFIPTSAGMIEDGVNPLQNKMPSWLPGATSGYWMDFHSGDPYTKIELGESRLPGAGYAALHPELEGVDPENYSDAYKYKILSDVALGSKEYYRVKNSIEKQEREGMLTTPEMALVAQTREQEEERSIQRKFSEYKTEDELKGVGVFGRVFSKYWEGIAHNAELPIENLTFFRPAGKMIHQRTAVEDYEKIQLVAPDIALWTNPVDHFLKPTLNSSIRVVNDDFIPEEVQEKRAVETYFDNLKYLKYRKLYQEASSRGEGDKAREYQLAYQKTMVGTATSELDNEREIVRSYIALPKAERPYFASFVNANEDDRDKILSMTSDSVGDIYKMIWRRKDLIEKVIGVGGDKQQVDAAVLRQIEEENETLKEAYTEEYKQYQKQYDGKTSFREYLADQQAANVVNEATGVPDENFIGWDPRIDLDDIKLRTLSVGKDDVHQYGFWKSDEEELDRITAILEEQQVVTQLEQIKQKIKNDRKLESQLADILYENGYRVRNLEVVDSGENSVSLNISKN